VIQEAGQRLAIRFGFMGGPGTDAEPYEQIARNRSNPNRQRASKIERTHFTSMFSSRGFDNAPILSIPAL